MVRVVLKESSLVCLLSLLGNGSVNALPQQRRIVGGDFCYAVHVVTNERRRLFLPELLVI
jgi:hypothetical protein